MVSGHVRLSGPNGIEFPAPFPRGGEGSDLRLVSCSANRRFSLFRLGLAVFLLIVAFLKIRDVVVTPTRAESTIFTPRLELATAEIELVIGIWLLRGAASHLAWWVLAVFFVAVTIVSAYSALTGQTDCGCFGDALILSNWQTFYKNIVILALVVISFSGRSKASWMNTSREWLTGITIAICITLFSFYNLFHLPVFDFRPYKVGTFIPDKMIIPEDAPADVYQQFFTLKDTTTGKILELESVEYMNDSTYWKNGTVWKFIASSEPRLVKKGYEPPIHDFSIRTYQDDDITQDVLNDSGYTFLMVAYDLKKTRTDKIKTINTLYKSATSDGHNFICLTAALEDEMMHFKKEHSIHYTFYVTDPITLKTIIRANPGIVLLHKGRILAKWNANDLPEYETIKQKFLLIR